MKKNIKLISLIITAILLVGAVIGISVSAETEGQAIRIAGQNIAYEGAPQILYLVETKTGLEEGQAVKLVYSTTKFEAVGTELPEGAVLKSVPMGENGEPLTVKANEKDYYPLFSDGIAPQNAAKAVYACPVIVDAEDNIVLAGKVVSYDVRQYARNRFAKGASDAQVALYTALLDYAASIQEVMMTEDNPVEAGAWADEYMSVTENTVFGTITTESSHYYVRPNTELAYDVEKWLENGAIFEGFTDVNGNLIGNFGGDSTSKTWDKLTVNVGTDNPIFVVNANYKSTKFDYLDGYYYTYEGEIADVIGAGSRFVYGVDAITSIWVSYQYKGTVYQYPTVTTDAAGNQTLTAGSESVLLYDATNKENKWITEEAYHALSDEEKATALVKIETPVSYASTGKVAYAETVESFDETNAAKITHAPFALEKTLAFNKGALLSYKNGTVLEAKYSQGIFTPSNSSANFNNDVYVFETDFNYVQPSGAAHALQLNINGSSNVIFALGITGSVSGKTFDLISAGKDRLEGGKTSNVLQRDMIADNLKQGQWYNIRVEIDTTEAGEYGVVTRVYLDGKLVDAYTQTYFNEDVSAYVGSLKNVTIEMTSSAPKTLTLDNTYIATEGDYVYDSYVVNPGTQSYTGGNSDNVTYSGVSPTYGNVDSSLGDEIYVAGYAGTSAYDFALQFKPENESGEVFVWESDVMVYGTAIGTDWVFRFDLTNKAGKNANTTLYLNNSDSTARFNKGDLSNNLYFSQNKWHRIRIEYTIASGLYRIYVDGKLAASKTVTANLDVTSLGIVHRGSSSKYATNYQWSFDNTYCAFQ